MPKTLVLICLCFGLSLSFFQPILKKQNSKLFYFAPPDKIKYFSLGFSDLYADLLWLRLLQNIDFCSSQKGLPIYDGKKKYQCEKGWSYKMTEAITELAPRFLAPYVIAGSIISIIVGDKLGAKRIYDKALKNFPENWRIHFSASYHYLVELEEEDKAAKLLIRTADLGGPAWLYALAAKTYKKGGRLLLAEEILKEALKKDVSGAYRKAFELRLKEVQEEVSRSQIRL